MKFTSVSSILNKLHLDIKLCTYHTALSATTSLLQRTCRRFPPGINEGRILYLWCDAVLTWVHPWRFPSCEIRCLHASPHLSDYWNNICFSHDHPTNTKHASSWSLKGTEEPEPGWKSTYDRSLPLCLSNSLFPLESKPSLRPMPRPRPPRPPRPPPPRPRIGRSPTGLRTRRRSDLWTLAGNLNEGFLFLVRLQVKETVHFPSYCAILLFLCDSAQIECFSLH